MAKKYFWLISRDSRHDHYVLYTVDWRVRLREEFRPLACARCGKVKELAALASGQFANPPVPYQTDWQETHDSVTLVSERVVEIFREASITGASFIDYGSGPKCRYSILLPTRFVRTNESESGMRGYERCSACNRRRECVGFPRLSSMELPEDDLTIVHPDAFNESVHGQRPQFLATSTVVAILKRAKVNGLSCSPATE